MADEVSLRDYFVERLDGQEKLNKQRFDAQEKAVVAALAAAKEAVAVAESNAEKWRMSANEWRGAMNDRERQFPTRQELWGYLIGAVFFVGTCFGVFTYIARPPQVVYTAPPPPPPVTPETPVAVPAK